MLVGGFASFFFILWPTNVLINSCGCLPRHPAPSPWMFCRCCWGTLPQESSGTSRRFTNFCAVCCTAHQCPQSALTQWWLTPSTRNKHLSRSAPAPQLPWPPSAEGECTGSFPSRACGPEPLEGPSRSAWLNMHVQHSKQNHTCYLFSECTTDWSNFDKPWTSRLWFEI